MVDMKSLPKDELSRVRADRLKPKKKTPETPVTAPEDKVVAAIGNVGVIIAQAMARPSVPVKVPPAPKIEVIVPNDDEWDVLKCTVTKRDLQGNMVDFEIRKVR